MKNNFISGLAVGTPVGVAIGVAAETSVLMMLWKLFGDKFKKYIVGEGCL